MFLTKIIALQQFPKSFFLTTDNNLMEYQLATWPSVHGSGEP